jgi:hypothetical protein
VGSSWGPACGHPVQPGTEFCGVCGEPVTTAGGSYPGQDFPGQDFPGQGLADQGLPGYGTSPTTSIPPVAGSPGSAPPPSAGSRQAWPPPPAQQVSPFSLASDTLPTELPSADGTDPWASWYGKPRAAMPDGPPAGMPDVYGAPTSYADAPSYGGPGQPGQYGPGQPYGGQPYGQYGEPAEYGAGQPYGGAQQYGGPYAGYPPPGGPAGPGGRRRGPLIPVAVIGAVAAAAVAGLVFATHGGGGGSPAGAASSSGSSASASASADPAQQAAARQLNTLLSQSGNDHSDVVGAVLSVEACKALRPARMTFGTAAGHRRDLLTRLATMPDKSALPPALLADLTTAWQASAQADTDMHDWAQDLISGGCHKGKTHDDQKYKDSLGPDSTASSAKARVSRAWQPLAGKYGLTAYQPNDL